MIAHLPPDFSTARPAFVARAGQRDLGPLPRNAPLRIGILFRYRDEAGVRQLVQLQSDRRSPLYKHYLTKAQWNATFAPDARAVATTLAKLTQVGFRVEFLAANRGFAILAAPAAIVADTFATRFDRIVHDGHVGFANVRAASIPAALRGAIVSVSGLSDFPVAKPPRARFEHSSELNMMVRRAPLEPRHVFAPSPAPTPTQAPQTPGPSPWDSPAPLPISTTTPAPNPSPEATLENGLDYVTSGLAGHSGYGPVALAVAYDFPVMHGYAGRGRTFADIIGAPYGPSDLTDYLNTYGIVRTAPTYTIEIDGGSNAVYPAGAVFEADADVEVAVGLAPDVTYDQYVFPVTSYDFQVEDAYNQAVSDDVADVVSSSFVNCENFDPAIEYADGYLAMQGAAKGMTFFAATGDNGGEACYLYSSVNGNNYAFEAVSVPAADIYFTAVGGTTLVVNPDNGAYVSEAGYVDGGGGTSIYEARPSWQAATAGTVASGRNIPDIALNAGAPFEEYLGGSSTPDLGTSFATPAMAALVAEIDEIQGTRNGWINPRLYQIQNTQGYTWAYRDVITGTNGTQTAGTGYDELTGIGSPLGWELAGEL